MAEQRDLDRVERDIVEYALKLRPVFDEMRRVLRASGVLVVQTKDLRYGGFLIPLSDIHTEMAAGAGFRLLSRVFWLPTTSPRDGGPHSSRNPEGRLQGLGARDVHGVLWTRAPPRGTPIDLEGPAVHGLTLPLWRTPARRRSDDHPFASPRQVIRRFIDLFTEPGDLVVDPFAGHGTTLLEARAMDAVASAGTWTQSASSRPPGGSSERSPHPLRSHAGHRARRSAAPRWSLAQPLQGPGGSLGRDLEAHARLEEPRGHHPGRPRHCAGAVHPHR